MVMETSSKGKWQIRIAVLTIFAVGFAAGALATIFYNARHWSSLSAERGGRFEKVFNKLDLTAEQKEQVRAIFDDARTQLDAIRKESEPRFRQVRKQTEERLQAVLTPEQWQQFQQTMNEDKGRRPRKRNNPATQP
jgi:Spy/CpxP family protein refolding chaperone